MKRTDGSKAIFSAHTLERAVRAFLRMDTLCSGTDDVSTGTTARKLAYGN